MSVPAANNLTLPRRGLDANDASLSCDSDAAAFGPVVGAPVSAPALGVLSATALSCAPAIAGAHDSAVAESTPSAGALTGAPTTGPNAAASESHDRLASLASSPRRGSVRLFAAGTLT